MKTFLRRLVAAWYVLRGVPTIANATVKASLLPSYRDAVIDSDIDVVCVVDSVLSVELGLHLTVRRVD